MNVLPANLQKVGYGLMSFTWVPSRKISPDQFNKAFKKVLQESGASSKSPLFINGGEFYGIPDRHEGLKLLGGFFKSNPGFADSVFVSIKGATNDKWIPDTTTENLVKCNNTIYQYLKPLYDARSVLPKKLDMFCLSRVGKELIEDVMSDLQNITDDGQISSICLSEVNSNTLARALSVGNVGAVEIEFSLFHREAINNALFARCVEFDIPAICYSPLGKGILVGMKPSDLPSDDVRNTYDRFKDTKVFEHNQKLVKKVHEIAERLNLTPAQVSISWITTLSGTERNGVKYPQLVPIPGSVNPDRQLNNQTVVKLSDQTMDEIDEILNDFETAGHRYNKLVDQLNDR